MGVLATYEVYLAIVAVATIVLRARFVVQSLGSVWTMGREHPQTLRTILRMAVPVLILPASLAALVVLLLLGAHAYVLHIAHQGEDLAFATLAAAGPWLLVVMVLGGATLGADAWNLVAFQRRERPNRKLWRRTVERLLQSRLRGPTLHVMRRVLRRRLLRIERGLNPWMNAWAYRMGLRAALGIALWSAISVL